MDISWIALYPDWYVQERRRLATHYPEFRVDDCALANGDLIYYGELVVRPPGGARRHPIVMQYPEATPFKPPIVFPLESLPKLMTDGTVMERPRPRMFDHRHQMPDGTLCLFQRETRRIPAGDIVTGTAALKRAEQWFLGHHTDHWPPDCADSELEAHFLPVIDVLLGGVFYSPSISGWGRFAMVPDLRRAAESPGERPAWVVTALTEETGVKRVYSARDDLSSIYWWFAQDVWDPLRIAVAMSQSNGALEGMQTGYWWSLPAEPRPFRDGRGLLRELAAAAVEGDAWTMVSSTLRSEISTSDIHWFGFRYPGRQGDFEWLIVCMPRDRQGTGVLIAGDADKRSQFEQSQVHCLRVHSARPTDLTFRNTGVVDEGVQTKVVALIGLGALGSSVAELLAKAGVGGFRLCDQDRLRVGNVARHVGSVDEFGARKTKVVEGRLLEINPYLRFAEGDVLSGSAVDSLDRLSGFLGAADLAVCTTADEGVESVVNQVAVLSGTVVVYGRALRRASMGRVFLVRPGVDACKGCLSQYAIDGREGRGAPDDWIDVVESRDDVLLHECGRPVIAASAIDLSFVAGLIARVVLDVLEGGAGEANHWLWSRLPAGEIDSRLDREMSTLVGRLDPWPGCPVCREPEVNRVLWSEDVRETIVSVAESSLQAETGGILIGFTDREGHAHVLRATGPGPKAERSRTGFSRDVDYVQTQLDRAASELGASAAYLGEWHSHLDADPVPSPTDINSLLSICEAPHYLTRCPVMVIAGVDPSSGRVHSVKSWAFQIGGRMYPLEAETLPMGRPGAPRGPQAVAL